MRSGRVVELWQDELGPFPPYRLDANALFVAYMASAEFGAHITLGWGQPVCTLDAYLEFRLLTNDARIKSGDRDKGFYSLDGALQFFGEDRIDTAHKTDMRDRILEGPPFRNEERREIIAYCRNDVEALVRLVPHIVPTIRSLPHVHFRGQFQWATAQQERRGVPTDLTLLDPIRAHWDDMRVDLVTEMDRPFGCYEIANGEAHWRKERFAAFVQRNRLPWPAHPSGALDTSIEAFEEMVVGRSWLEPLRELRSTISKLKLNQLEIGRDGRNRTLLSAYGSKTGRSQPSTTKYIFGPAKWLRFLIAPPPGLALVHRDYCQQEIQIAAVLSGDLELLAACETGDAYLGIAKALGFTPPGATGETHAEVRTLFKTVVLGIIYGLGTRSLAKRTAVSLFEAGEILARLRARFRIFEDYASRVADHAGLQLEIGTQFGWRMRCPSGVNPRTIRNFPMQSTAAEILHVACILAERRGLRIIAPVHDALMAESPVNDIENTSKALDQVMRDASRIVLRGYELRTDKKIVLPGGHFSDKRGQAMWDTVSRLVAKFETEQVA
jgi:hypothetical protein